MPLAQIGDKLDEGWKRRDRTDDRGQNEDFFGEKKRGVAVCDKGNHKLRITLVQVAGCKYWSGAFLLLLVEASRLLHLLM